MKFKFSGSKKDLQNAYNERYQQWETEKIRPLQMKFANRDFQKEAKWILDMFKGGKNKKLLDLGCGTGKFLEVAIQRGLQVIGFDISDYAVEKAKKVVQMADLLVSDAENLPFSDNCFDYVVCYAALEHIPNQEKAIREMSRILAGGGRAVVLVPNKFSVGNIFLVYKTGEEQAQAGQEFSEVLHTKAEWQRKLERSGLRVVKTFKDNNMWATSKVSFATAAIFNLFIRHFIPLNLSYNLIFVLEKR